MEDDILIGFKEQRDLKVAAVVVTHNRLPFLRKIIKALNNQTRSLDKIILVDNDSSDDTARWAHTQSGIYYHHQRNVGGAGGFHTGISLSYQMGYDWIWCMDDDVEPDPDCLRLLLMKAVSHSALLAVPSKLSPDRRERYTNAGRFVLGKTNWLIPDGQLELEEGREWDSVSYFTFEGPLISNEYVRCVGLPERANFILVDDTEYALRGILHFGKEVGVFVPEAIVCKLLPQQKRHVRSKRLFLLRNTVRMWERHGFRHLALPFRARLLAELKSSIKSVLRRPRREKFIRALASAEAYISIRIRFGPFFLAPKFWADIDVDD